MLLLILKALPFHRGLVGWIEEFLKLRFPPQDKISISTLLLKTA